MAVVLDASAVIAFLRGEAGAETVEQLLAVAEPAASGHTGLLSTVNAAEVYQSLNGLPTSVFGDRGVVRVVPFELEHARRAAALHESTAGLGLSFPARACLALALVTKCPVVTTDAQWLKLDVGVKIEHVGLSLVPGTEGR